MISGTETSGKASRGPYRVLLIEDHPIVRQGLAEFISRQCDMTVCGEADTKRTALALAERMKPDLVILDLTLGAEDGFPLLEELCRRMPSVPVLVLSMHDENLYAERCLKGGAKGYLMKSENAKTILAVARKLLRGETFLSKQVQETLLTRVIHGRSGSFSTPFDLLSNRELQVFRLVGSGQKSSEIAGQLNISVKTVGTHMENIKRKLELPDTRSLLVQAVQWMNGASEGRAGAVSRDVSSGRRGQPYGPE